MDIGQFSQNVNIVEWNIHYFVMDWGTVSLQFNTSAKRFILKRF